MLALWSCLKFIHLSYRRRILSAIYPTVILQIPCRISCRSLTPSPLIPAPPRMKFVPLRDARRPSLAQTLKLPREKPAHRKRGLTTVKVRDICTASKKQNWQGWNSKQRMLLKRKGGRTTYHIFRQEGTRYHKSPASPVAA